MSNRQQKVLAAGRWIRTVRDALTVVLLLVVIAFVAYLAATARRASIVLKDLPEIVRTEFRIQGDETRRAALDGLDRIRVDTLAEARETRRETLERIDRLTKVTNAAIERLTFRVDDQMSTLNRNLDGALHRVTDDVGRSLRGVDPVLVNVAGITGQVNDALPMFLECEGNDNCVFKRYVRVSDSIDTSTAAFAETAPPTLRAVQSTSESVSSIAESWAKQTPLHVRVIGWLGKVGLAFRGFF